jgi:hypothetical protein
MQPVANITCCNMQARQAPAEALYSDRCSGVAGGEGLIPAAAKRGAYRVAMVQASRHHGWQCQRVARRAAPSDCQVLQGASHCCVCTGLGLFCSARLAWLRYICLVMPVTLLSASLSPLSPQACNGVCVRSKLAVLCYVVHRCKKLPCAGAATCTLAQTSTEPACSTQDACPALGWWQH